MYRSKGVLDFECSEECIDFKMIFYSLYNRDSNDSAQMVIRLEHFFFKILINFSYGPKIQKLKFPKDYKIT